MPTNSGGVVASLPLCITFSVKSSHAQAAIIIALIVLAELTVFTVHGDDHLFWLTLLGFVLVIGLEIYATIVFAFRRTVEAPIFIFTLSCLLASGIATIFYNPAIAVTAALVLPYIVMSMRQDGLLHRLLSLLALPPLLLAIAEHWLRSFWRNAVWINLWVPAVTLLVCKVTALACRRGGLKLSQTLLNVLLAVTAAATVLGAAAAAAALAAAPREQQAACTYAALTATLAAGLAFNACLVIRRFKNPKPLALVGCTGSEMVMPIARLLEIGPIVAAIFLVVFLIYQFLEFFPGYELFSIIPVAMLACFYLLAVFLHDPIRGMTPKWLYFLLIIGAFITAEYAMPRPEHRTRLGTQSGEWKLLPLEVGPLTKEELSVNHLRSTLFFASLECCLFLVYLMMTVLQKEDQESSTSSIEERQNMLPVVLAAVSPVDGEDRLPLKLEASVAGKPCCSVETYSDESREESSRHATLHLPD